MRKPIHCMIAGIFISSILLALCIWDFSSQVGKHKIQQLQTQLHELVLLEISYIGSNTATFQPDEEVTETASLDQTESAAMVLESLLARQSVSSEIGYRFSLLRKAPLYFGFTSSFSETGGKEYTYYASIPNGDWYLAVSAPDSVLSVSVNFLRHLFVIFFLRVFGIAAFLFFIFRLAGHQGQFLLLNGSGPAMAREERYCIAVAQMVYFVFEYEFGSGIIRIVSGNLQNGRFLHDTRQLQKELWTELIHPNDLPQLSALKEKITEEQREFTQILRIRSTHDTAEYRWYRLSFTFLPDPHGQTGKAIGSVLDINEQQTETLVLRRKAEHDSLTGLFNREECERKVEQLLADRRKESSGVFILMDLDDFKALNDSMGHVTGDEALRMFASVIRQVFRETDIAGRMGGDEFMVWLKDISDTDLVNRKLSELNCALQSLSHGNREIPPLPFSIGYVFGRSGDHFLNLYQMADTALYQAKKTGRNRYVYYPRSEHETLSV